jgi:hypothetical protein
LEIFQVSFWRGSIARDAVHFLAVLVYKERRWGSIDIEFLEDRIPDLIACAGAVVDKILGNEIGILGIIVELLNQQFACPSATREKVYKDKLIFLFGLGQSVFERSAHELGRLGRSDGSDENKAGERRNLLHHTLLAGYL